MAEPQVFFVNEFKIPVSPTRSVDVSGDFPLTPREWAQMLAVLAAMKPALVIDPDNS